MKELGPDEGINRLQHPDCRACKERDRLNLGIMAENRALKGRLQRVGLRSLGEAIEVAEHHLDAGSSAADLEAAIARIDAARAILAPFGEERGDA